MGSQQGKKALQALMPKEIHGSCPQSKPTASRGPWATLHILQLDQKLYVVTVCLAHESLAAFN